jgi:hypothetical protein
MLRSVVMPFVLSSVFFGLHVTTLLVTFDLSWGALLCLTSSTCGINCRRISRTFSVSLRKRFLLGPLSLLFVISSPRRFVSRGTMAPSDSALLDALHTAEYKLVISERQVRAEVLHGLRPLGDDVDLQLADDGPRFLAAQCC